MKATLVRVLLTAILAGLFPTPSRAESVVVQWEKRYNGPANAEDFPSALAVDNDGNVIVAGYSLNANTNIFAADYYTVKYAAAAGAEIWVRRYNGPTNSFDSAQAVVVDSAGNVIVTGSSRGGRDWDDWYTAKYAASSGALLWEQRYNGPADGPDYANDLEVDRDGNVIVTGEIAAVETSPSSFTKDIYTAKYAAANGAVLWAKQYNGPGNRQDSAAAVEVDGDGNVLVAGYVNVSSGRDDAYTAKYAAANGSLLWEKRFRAWREGNFLPYMEVDSEGNAIVTASSPGTGGNNDVNTVKYAAANGALLWEKKLNGLGYPYGLAVDGEGNAIVRAKYGDHTAKYAAADGELVWAKGSNSGNIVLLGVATDTVGNVIVCGTTYRNGVGGVANQDSYTAKYAAADGALLWEQTYDGPGNQSDRAYDIAVDSAGSVIVTGASTGSSGNYDYYTVKYAPVDLDLDNDGLLDSWETAHFGGTAGQSALDDTDGDGAVELLELAFGTDPRKPGAGAGPAVVVEGGYLSTTIAKQPGVSYLVQSGATLASGFSVTSTTVLTDTATSLKVRDNILIGTQPARFLRVQVTAAP